MKKGFFKDNWASMLITALFVAATAYQRDVIIGIISVVFILVLVINYVRFDEDEKMYDGWWNNLSKEDKKQLYEKK